MSSVCTLYHTFKVFLNMMGCAKCGKCRQRDKWNFWWAKTREVGAPLPIT
jgi:hypothetical protein